MLYYDANSDSPATPPPRPGVGGWRARVVFVRRPIGSVLCRPGRYGKERRACQYRKAKVRSEWDWGGGGVCTYRTALVPDG